MGWVPAGTLRPNRTDYTLTTPSLSSLPFDGIILDSYSCYRGANTTSHFQMDSPLLMSLNYPTRHLLCHSPPPQTTMGCFSSSKGFPAGSSTGNTEQAILYSLNCQSKGGHIDLQLLIDSAFDYRALQYDVRYSGRWQTPHCTPTNESIDEI